MPSKVTLYLDDDVADKLKQMEISPTKLCRYMIKWYMKDYDKDIGKMFKIVTCQEKINKLKNEIYDLEAKKLILEQLEHELKIYKEEYAMSLGSMELSEKLSSMARRIVIHHYDERILKLKYKDTLDRIKQLNKKYSLKTHIQRVKKAKEIADKNREFFLPEN